MAVSLTPEPHIQFSDATGAPLASGKVFTFAAGTSTPLATFTDSTGGTPNANPVILDAGGFANIWLTNNVGYKIQVQNAAGSTLWTVDNVLNTVFVGVSPQKQIFTAGGTFTIPAGVTQAKVMVTGGGGAGGGGTAVANAGGMGGAAAATAIKWLTSLTPGNTITVAIGSGGTGVAGAAGNAGGNSSISSGTQIISTVTANGGSGGASGTSAGVTGGTATGGDLNFVGNGTDFNIPGTTTNGSGRYSAPSYWGGAVPGASAGNGANGTTGGAPGAGGSGGGTAGGGTSTGGAGKDGIVIFEWVA